MTGPANLQSIKDEHPSVQIKLEPMELEEDCDFVYEDEEDLMLSSKKKKGRSKNSSNFASSLDPLTGKVKIKSTKKAAKKKNPSKDWYDNGITMTNPKNPSVYGCLSCEPHEDSSFKSTTCYVTLVEHLRKFHALLDLEQVWSLTQLYSVLTFHNQGSCKKVHFQQTHNQGLRQLLLTVSWDLRA